MDNLRIKIQRIKKIKILSPIIFIALFAVIGFIFLHTAKAQDIQTDAGADQTISFSISPLVQEYDIEAGKVTKGFVKVFNQTDKDVIFEASPTNFTPVGNSGQVDIHDDSNQYSIRSWIRMQTGFTLVKPKSSATFDYVINVPMNVEPGSHWGAITVSTSKPPVNPNISQSITKQAIASLIILKAPGNVKEKVTILGTSDTQKIFTDPEVKLNTTVENQGNVHIKATGYYNIYDILGNKVKTVNLEERNVLPEAKRDFSSVINFDGVGPYKEEFALTYSGKTMVSTTTFWALNLEKTLSIVGIIVLLLGIYIVFRKRINKATHVLIRGDKDIK
ncbi:MAG: hypothetical protein WCO33_01125 [bacterium]